MSKDIVEPEGPQMTSQYGGALLAGLVRLHAHQHTSAPVHPHPHPHTHTEKYVILISFPLQQWFRERASMLRYTYIAYLVVF